jgi:hypothetical protein
VDTGEYEMTLEVHVKNANTDWRDTRRVRVTVQEQNATGEWNDAPYEPPVLLAAGAPLAAKWVHKRQRLIVDEIDT